MAIQVFSKFYSITHWTSQFIIFVTTLLLEECEDDTHTLEMGTWEFSGTPESLEFDCRGQNTLPWGVLHVIEKLLKCRYRKWPCMSHLDIFSISYGKKKGRESNWQFDSRPLKVRNRPNPGVCRWSATQRSLWVHNSVFRPPIGMRFEVNLSKPGRFQDSSGVPRQKAIRMWVPRSNAENIIWGKVVASPEFEPWWVFWVQSCPWLVLAPRVL